MKVRGLAFSFGNFIFKNCSGSENFNFLSYFSYTSGRSDLLRHNKKRFHPAYYQVQMSISENAFIFKIGFNIESGLD